MKKLFLFVLPFLIAGCGGTMVYKLDTLPVNKYPVSDKIDLTIELRISKELETYSHESAGEKLPLGNLIVKNAENMSRALFRQVTVTTGIDNPTQSGIDAILIPKIVSAAHTRPMFAYSERKLTVVLQWLLKDAEGNTIWVDTIEGVGVNEIGTAFSLNDKTRERVKLLMDDLFKKSYLSISSSKEIKNFKPEI